jgi:sugar phosphate isomerase/epimerase
MFQNETITCDVRALVMRAFENDTTALALNTATLGHNLPGRGAGWDSKRVIDACAERGFGAITFWTQELSENAYEIGNYTKSTGLEISGLCRTPYLTGSQAGSDSEVRKTIDIAAELGADVLTIVTGGTNPGSKGILETQKILADRLSNFSEYAKDNDVSLALEPLNPMFGGNRTVLMTAQDAIHVCNMVGAENLGLAIDVYHVWWDSTLEQTLNSTDVPILGYHICDWLEDTSDMLLDRGMMGDGVADLREVRRIVEATGYAGYCEVEIFSSEHWWQEDPAHVLDTIVKRYKSVC